MTDRPLPLTKSDFLEARRCPASHAVRTKLPDRFASAPPSAYDLMLMEEGKAVHAAARHWLAASEEWSHASYEVVFESDCGLVARADAALLHENDAVDLLEVKASTKPDTHLVDLAFQAVTARRSGKHVGRCILVHLDSAWRCDPASAQPPFIARDVTEAIRALEIQVEAEIAEIRSMEANPPLSGAGCECRFLGAIKKRCPAFDFLNPTVPPLSAHLLPRISGARLRKLDAEGRLAIQDVRPEDVTPAQSPHLSALRSGKPHIDRPAIRDFLAGLLFPLHFYDYETHARAIPNARGHGPHMQVPVQFSLHVLHADGRIDHHEFLAASEGQEDELVAALQAASASSGTFISWNMAFEKGRNAVLASLLPHRADFLAAVDGRTVDLMAPFRGDLVHPGFGGSASIKHVLPVICPDLAYPTDDVHDGAGAIAAWREMVSAPGTPRAGDLRRQLLAYCRLDTFAMVRIYRHLVELVAEADDESGPSGKK